MKKKQTIPYMLVVVSNKWVGNFERELIGYSMGILDDVQMDIDFADEERAAFWKEVFNEDNHNYCGDYELIDEYLFETHQDVDDWDQMTFYNVSGLNSDEWKFVDGNEDSNSLIYIQLAKPLSEEWENIVIPRIKKWFSDEYDSYWKDSDTKLLGLRLYKTDGKPQLVKDYLV